MAEGWMEAIRQVTEDPTDASEIEAVVRQMGTPDEVIGERLQLERLSFTRALRSPLRRSSEAYLRANPLLPGGADRPRYWTRTFQVSSGAVYQVQRRYAGEAELERVMRGERSPEPALRIRRLDFPATAPPLDYVDAATVIEDESH